MSEEDKEQASLLDRVGKTLFPERHLAPWASIQKRREVMVNMGLRTIADIGEELDRRSWLDRHPGEELPNALRTQSLKFRLADLKAWKKELDPEKEAERIIRISNEISDIEALIKSKTGTAIEEVDEAPDTDSVNANSVEFDPTGVRGAAGMFAFCARALAINSHDLAPSIDGVGRKQAGNIAQAMKSGVAVEPPKRTAWEKLTRRGKEKEKI